MKKSVLMVICASLLMALSIGADTSAPPVIAVTPSRTAVKIAPGNTYNVEYKIENKSDEQITVKVTAEDWTNFAQKVRGKSVDEWITFSHREINIEPLSEAVLLININMPADATGQKMAQIFFQPAYSNVPEMMLKTKLGAIVVAIADGTEQVSITEPVVSIFGSERENPEVSVQFENLGNVLLRWSADVILIDTEAGAEIGTAKIDISERSVLPTEKGNNKKAVKNYVINNSGKIRAKLTLRYGVIQNSENIKEYDLPVTAQ